MNAQEILKPLADAIVTAYAGTGYVLEMYWQEVTDYCVYPAWHLISEELEQYVVLFYNDDLDVFVWEALNCSVGPDSPQPISPSDLVNPTRFGGKVFEKMV